MPRSFLLPWLLWVLVPAQAAAFTYQEQQDFTQKGQTMTFDFTGLPPPSSSTVTVTVDLFGDYSSPNKYAQVWINGQQQADHPGGTTCGLSPDSKDYVLGNSEVQNGTLGVVVTNTTNVDAACTTPNRVVVRITYPAQPDLTITSTTAPASGSTSSAGSTFAVDFSVRCWHEALTTNFYVEFYHCPSNTPYACTKLGQQYVSDNFAAGEELDLSGPTLTVPASAAYGTSYVQVVVDATDAVNETVEDNNVVYDAINLTTEPDLYVSAATVPESGSTAGAGSWFTGSYTVNNKSSTSAVLTNFSVAYYYCSTSSSSSCAVLGQQVVTTDIDSGGSHTLTTPVLTLPTSASPGTRYIRAELDSNQVVSESNESNNEHYTAITVTGVSVDAGPPPDMGEDGPGGDGPASDGSPHDGPADAGAGETLWQWPDTTPPATRDSAASTADTGSHGGGSGSDGCAFGRGPGGAGEEIALALLVLLVLLPRRLRGRLTDD